MADTLTIKSNDGQEFTLSKDQYEQSEYLKEQAGIGSEDAVEIFSMDATVLTKVVDFFTKNKENPIPVAEIEHPDPFGPQGEGKAKLIPKVCTATSGASGFNSARPVPCPAQPLSSPNLAEHNFPAWSVEWVDSLSRDDLFAYARHSEELSVHPMTLLVCGKIATLIKAMSMEEYKEAFRLEKDFSPEEEAKIRADNAWAES